MNDRLFLIGFALVPFYWTTAFGAAFRDQRPLRDGLLPRRLIFSARNGRTLRFVRYLWIVRHPPGDLVFLVLITLARLSFVALLIVFAAEVYLIFFRR